MHKNLKFNINQRSGEIKKERCCILNELVWAGILILQEFFPFSHYCRLMVSAASHNLTMFISQRKRQALPDYTLAITPAISFFNSFLFELDAAQQYYPQIITHITRKK